MSITSRINEMSTHIEQAYDELQGLGADLTDVDKNIENISMVLDDIYDSLPSVSDEGTSLTLDDTRVGKIKSTLKGNTSQTGTPTPSSPIPVNVVSGDNEINICGRNLAYTGWTEDFVSRINNSNRATITTKDNRKCLYWIASAGYPDYDTNYMFTTNWKDNTQYTISFDLFTTSSNGFGNICIEYTDGTRQEINGAYNTWTHKTTTSTSGKTIKNIHTYYRSENSYIDLDTFMVYEGTETLPYEPYQGNTYNIDLPVKNLFDISKITENTYLSSDGATGTSSASNLSDYIQILPSKPCTISYTYTTLLNPSVRAYCWYTESKTYINGNNYNPANAPVTLTAPSNAKYIRFAYDKNCTNIQLQQSSKATPYGTTPIELCKIGNYQDYIYKEDGSWYLHKEIGKVVLDGSESWSVVQLRTNTSLFSLSVDKMVDIGNVVGSDLFSNYFTAKDVYNRDVEGTEQIRKILFISIATSDLATFKTWLGTHITNVYYILATPTNTEITYQPLIDQLNLLEKAMSKDGQTNISQVNNDLPFIISASALKEWQESASLNSTLSMVNPLSLGNTLNTQENNTQPIEVDNIEPLEEEENEES